MVDYGKLIDSKLHYAKMPLEIGGRHVFTNNKDILMSEGYKPVVYTDITLEEGHLAEYSWQENEDEIRQVWTLIVLDNQKGEDNEINFYDS